MIREKITFTTNYFFAPFATVLAALAAKLPLETLPPELLAVADCILEAAAAVMFTLAIMYMFKISTPTLVAFRIPHIKFDTPNLSRKHLKK